MHIFDKRKCQSYFFFIKRERVFNTISFETLFCNETHLNLLFLIHLVSCICIENDKKYNPKFIFTPHYKKWFTENIWTLFLIQICCTCTCSFDSKAIWWFKRFPRKWNCSELRCCYVYVLSRLLREIGYYGLKDT